MGPGLKPLANINVLLLHLRFEVWGPGGPGPRGPDLLRCADCAAYANSSLANYYLHGDGATATASGGCQGGFRLASGWLQVGFRLASRGFQVGFWLASGGFQVGFRLALGGFQVGFRLASGGRAPDSGLKASGGLQVAHPCRGLASASLILSSGTPGDTPCCHPLATAPVPGNRKS